MLFLKKSRCKYLSIEITNNCYLRELKVTIGFKHIKKSVLFIFILSKLLFNFSNGNNFGKYLNALNAIAFDAMSGSNKCSKFNKFCVRL